MAEDAGKKDEEKFEFTSEGEVIGYISLDQAQVLAMRTAREQPGAYGSKYLSVPMAFDVVESTETEDHYVVAMHFRPQGEFSGRPGREQFFIEKEGPVAHRQVLSLPRRRSLHWIPSLIGLAVIDASAAIWATLAVGPSVGDKEFPGLAPAPTAVNAVSEPTSATSDPTPENTSKPESPALMPAEALREMAFVPINHQGGLEITAQQAVAQVFTAPVDGVITGVSFIGLSSLNCDEGEDLEFRLLATDQGLPGSLIFYSETLPSRAIPSQPGTIGIKLGSDGWTVGKFESLALELSIGSPSEACTYSWDGDSNASYSGGQAFTRRSEGGVWEPINRDMGFRILPPLLPR